MSHRKSQAKAERWVFPKGWNSRYKKGIIIPFAKEIPYQDAFEIYRRVYGRGSTVFLDSSRFHPETAAYSYICMNPFARFSFSGGKDPVGKLRKAFSRLKGSRWSCFPHFTGGAVGFLSYELSRDLEKFRTRPREANPRIPKILLLFMRDLIVFDHRGKRALILTNLLPSRDGSVTEALRAARRRIGNMENRIAVTESGGFSAASRVRTLRSNCSRKAFEAMVRRAKQYIRAGDIYQANLSRQFSFDFDGEPLRLYERLRKVNPSPFSSFFDFGDLTIVSASPERLIRLIGDRCETRPIAGTIRRGHSAAEAHRLSRHLVRDPKERAEHLMLVDLERNDLGRVCRYRSVRIRKMMMTEKYSHVIHIVSSITGRLRSGKDRFDLLKAVFPGGTITGCPKIRSMEIIEELEPCARGLYTGSIGYIDFNGNMDWNIVIRTLILHGRKGFIQTGAGIVHDSKPDKEYRETLHKAKALILSLKRR